MFTISQRLFLTHIALSSVVVCRKFLYEPFPVESSLLSQLHNHINAEVCGGTITCVQDAIDWVTWTYAFRRIVQNPSYYKCESNAPEAIHAFLVSTLAHVFDDLVDAGCIAQGSSGSSSSSSSTSSHLDDDAVRPTPLGRIASYYYLEYTTIKRFNDAMSDGMQLPALLTALTAAAEFDELPVRHNEDLVNAELARIVPWPIAGAAPACFESPHAKAALLLQCHFSHLPLPVSDYYTDTKSVLDQTLRVANAMIDIAAERQWLTTALRVRWQ